MSLYINKAFIFGNLTANPELCALPSGKNVTRFTIATNRKFHDGKEWREVLQFHSVVAFGKMAENIVKYLAKGSSLFVEGRIETQNWTDTKGQKRYKTEIIAEEVQFGPRKEQITPKDTPQDAPGEAETPQDDGYPKEESHTEAIPF